MYMYLFAVYFCEVKFVWIERLSDAVYRLRFSPLVKSHLIQLKEKYR